ncbi:kinase domain protein [Teladorsagia circumcincta]|uniref:Kinase domain protein n=1 Tax=Teladorsagia circumcincta TaxID=45464 RepID=A0A2G9V0U8_TELCI|nr:kinase domain protein [Teladorsagia circumcincta]
MFSKHHRDKRLKEEDAERMRKERLTKRDSSRTPSPDEILMGGVRKRSPVERSERIKRKEKQSEITSFTLDSPAGPQKYSKFDSSPEAGGPDDQTPEHSPVAEYSDVEMEPEPEFDPSTATYETLTDEQKALLSPDTKKRLESEWQSRLIAQLPVYYAYEIVALKRLKIEKEREGFPITALREINMLLKAGKHENIVNVQEILIGSNADKIYLAMEFVEHDMKNLMDTMHKRGKRFTFGEQKTLMRQLLSGLKHLHDNWILHRDLKTSNLLFSHKGILKIADFGLAREYGDPLRAYTAVVVTLWYRAPELLLGQKLYSTPIDLWSVGCIMGEFVLLKPLFPGNGELDEINKIFTELGTPSDSIWEGYSELPGPKMMKLGNFPYNQLRKKFPASAMNESGFKLLNRFLTYDPKRRITAEEALNDKWFTEDPKPTPPEMFPTFPAKSEQHRAPPPKADKVNKKAEIINPERAKLLADLKVRPDQVTSGSFSLKFDKTRF